MTSATLRRRSLQTTALAGALILGFGASTAGQAQAQDRTYSFSIPPEPLARALQDYGRATTQQLVFTEALVAGKTAPAVRGALASDAALHQILDGSGLVAQRTPAGALLIQAGYAQPGAAGDPTSFPAAAPSAGGKPGNAGPTLSEIVVTADRKNSFSADYVQAGSFRGARALDTPLTVAVIPQQVLQSQQAVQLLDALKNTAGVNQAQTSSVVYTNISIRGIAVDTRANYRLDGDLPILSMTDIPLEDKDRVEALKGASALYYGFTTPSGIINLVMKRPTPSQFIEVTAQGNDYGAVDGHVDYGNTWGPFGARINLLYGQTNPGIQYTKGLRSLASGAFDYKPNDRLTINADLEYFTKRMQEPGYFRFLAAPTPTLGNPYPSMTLPQLINPRDNFGARWALNDTAENNVLVNATYKLTDAWNLEVDAGRSQMVRKRHNDQLEITDPLTDVGVLALGLQTSADLNQSLRGQVTGTFNTGPLTHEVMVGVSDVIRDQKQPSVTYANCLGGVATAPPASCTESAFNPTNFLETPYPSAHADTTRIADIGLYGFDRIKYSNWLELIGGIRYSDYRESDYTTNATTFAANPIAYSAGLLLKPRPWVTLYATYIDGLESTGMSPTTVVNANQQLPPAYSTQYEGGIKLEPKRGLLFQAAYFDINRESTYTNAQNIFVEDGRNEYRGVEASLTGEITRDLSIYVSALALDAKTISAAPTSYSYSNGTTSTVFNPALVLKAYSPTLQGKFVEDTPKVTFSASAEYHVPFVNGFSVEGGVYYIASRYINPQNEAQIPGYTLVDLGGSYKTTLYDHDTTFRINAYNVGNVRYFMSAGALVMSEGPPPEVRFSVSSRY